MNKVIVTGRLTVDVEAKYIKGSKMMVANFCLAVDGGKTKAGDDIIEFINFTVFDKLAEFAANYFEKGKRYLVEGYLHRDDYTDKDGAKRYDYKVIGQRLEFADGK